MEKFRKMRTLTAAVVLGMVLTGPGGNMAWAQLETLEAVDPALKVACEALIDHDPALADPELKEIFLEVAEATVEDPIERAAVTKEVLDLQQEGVNVMEAIPSKVRETARTEFAKVREKMQADLEALRTTDPDAAKEMELAIREGERCMLAFEAGERYVPSPEMVTHAKEVFESWKENAVANGVSDRELRMAELSFQAFSQGETMPMMEGGFGQMGGEPPTETEINQMVQDGFITADQAAKIQEASQVTDPAAREAMMKEVFGSMEHDGFEHYREMGSQMEANFREQFENMPKEYQEQAFREFEHNFEQTYREYEQLARDPREFENQSQLYGPAPSPEPAEVFLRAETRDGVQGNVFRHSDSTEHFHPTQ